MPRSAAATKARKSPPRKRKSAASRSIWPLLIPILIGIGVTFLAVRAASILALEGPQAFTVLYPWVTLARARVFGMGWQTSDSLAQAALYLQFPLYGLLSGVVWMHSRRFHRGFMAAFAAHIVGILLVLAASFLH
jgi:uncharacterized membrane protein